MKTFLIAGIVAATLATGASAQSDGSAQASGLTHEQMHQFQQALKDDGCYRGRVDGVMGAGTRRAIACSRKKHDVNGNNINELFRAINFDVTVNDSVGMGALMRRGHSSANRPPEKHRDRTINDRDDKVQHDSADGHRAHATNADSAARAKGAGKKVKP